MYISDTDRRHSVRIGVCYFFTAVLCGIFSTVYEHFGHGVYSAYMIFAFAFPLLGGALPFFIIGIFRYMYPGRIAENLYSSGIAALTVGSLFEGALEIYGTSNSLSIVYTIVGSIGVMSGTLIYIFKIIRNKKKYRC